MTIGAPFCDDSLKWNTSRLALLWQRVHSHLLERAELVPLDPARPGSSPEWRWDTADTAPGSRLWTWYPSSTNEDDTRSSLQTSRRCKMSRCHGSSVRSRSGYGNFPHHGTVIVDEVLERK